MEIVIPKGIKIGHAQDDFTGVTVILAEKGMTASVDVRGGAPGTRETDLLKPDKAVQKVNAIVLSGGSAYGLAATCGVMDFLRERNIGHRMLSKVVPIVSGAVIYDLNDREYHYPDAKMGYAACENATGIPVFGQVGAGKGATAGKLRGVRNSSKSGIGAYTVRCAGITVTAVVCVNAFGDVVESDGTIIAGAKGKNSQFIDTNACLLQNKLGKIIFGGNTTIGCILTNARLTKIEANKIASVGHNGLARSIRPVHTDFDGDTLFCMSTGRVPVLNFALLQIAAVEAVENAVRNAVKSGLNYDVKCDNDEDDSILPDA